MKNDCSKEDRLPMFYRTMKLPKGLWEKVRQRGEEEGKALRWIAGE